MARFLVTIPFCLPVLLAVHCGDPQCPADMVLVPGGRVTIGVEQPAAPYEQTAHRVRLAPYCMDRFEYPNVEGEIPRYDLSWNEADRLCQEQGKRLCSSAEWERACRGTQGHRYAYGRNRLPHFCNTPYRSSRDGPVPYAASGSHPKCVSEDGIYDLNGNLSEWVADGWAGDRQPMDDDYGREHPMREVRGGTMWAATFYGQDCLSRHGHPANAQYEDDGFRCCKDAR